MPAFRGTSAFFAARDAWAAARITRQREEGTSDRSATSLSRRMRLEQWRVRKLPTRPGSLARSNGVTVDRRLHTHLVEHAAALPGAIVESLDWGMSTVAFNAWRQMPVRTGLAKSAIDLEYAALGEQYRGRIAWNIDYWRFVPTDRGQAFRVLLRDPWLWAGHEIVRRIALTMRRSR